MKGAHVPVIVEIVRGMATVSPVRYLELGIGSGQTFNAVAPMCDEAWAVDKSGVKLSSAKKADNVLRLHATTDDFFKEWTGRAVPFDVTFIDALHTEDQAVADFNRSWETAAGNGLILLHDGHPPNAGGFSPMKSGTVWKAVARIRAQMRECVTLPFGHGITIVRKATRQLMWEGAPDDPE